ncbi:MAG: DUF1987 domain-containing protein [Bacteroidales bacterium]|nr:DUF1987 domain-containing protein [Bacteroidales bacterium]MBS3773695.1 DUF1987 domain-containing protein [Bacteroidales bacterium]
MAEKLYIASTSFTPEVDFDPKRHKFKMAGVSRPEDAYEFYEPVLSWVHNYIKGTLEDYEQNKLLNETFIIVFDFEYMNSSSSKYIFQIISNFKKFYEKRLNLNIFWYYDDPDDQILEDGEDFSEIIDIPFNFLIRKN